MEGERQPGEVGRDEQPCDTRAAQNRLVGADPAGCAKGRSVLDVERFDVSASPVSGVLSSGAFVAVAVIASHPCHQFLRIAGQDVLQEIRRRTCAQNRGDASVMANPHLSGPHHVILESFRRAHPAMVRRILDTGTERHGDGGIRKTVETFPISGPSAAQPV